MIYTLFQSQFFGGAFDRLHPRLVKIRQLGKEKFLTLGKPPPAFLVKPKNLCFSRAFSIFRQRGGPGWRLQPLITPKKKRRISLFRLFLNRNEGKGEL